MPPCVNLRERLAQQLRIRSHNTTCRQPLPRYSHTTTTPLPRYPKQLPRHATHNVDPGLINPRPLIRNIIGILILRPLEGGGLLIMGIHYALPKNLSKSRLPFLLQRPTEQCHKLAKQRLARRVKAASISLKLQGGHKTWGFTIREKFSQHMPETRLRAVNPQLRVLEVSG